MVNKKYPEELKERAVRLVLASQSETGGRLDTSAQVTVAIESTDAVLTVPTSAVHRDGSGRLTLSTCS